MATVKCVFMFLHYIDEQMDRCPMVTPTQRDIAVKIAAKANKLLKANDDAALQRLYDTMPLNFKLNHKTNMSGGAPSIKEYFRKFVGCFGSSVVPLSHRVPPVVHIEKASPPQKARSASSYKPTPKLSQSRRPKSILYAYENSSIETFLTVYKLLVYKPTRESLQWSKLYKELVSRIMTKMNVPARHLDKMLATLCYSFYTFYIDEVEKGMSDDEPPFLYDYPDTEYENDKQTVNVYKNSKHTTPEYSIKMFDSKHFKYYELAYSETYSYFRDNMPAVQIPGYTYEHSRTFGGIFVSPTLDTIIGFIYDKYYEALFGKMNPEQARKRLQMVFDSTIGAQRDAAAKRDAYNKLLEKFPEHLVDYIHRNGSMQIPNIKKGKNASI